MELNLNQDVNLKKGNNVRFQRRVIRPPNPFRRIIQEPYWERSQLRVKGKRNM